MWLSVQAKEAHRGTTIAVATAGNLRLLQAVTQPRGDIGLTSSHGLDTSSEMKSIHLRHSLFIFQLPAIQG